MRVLLTTDTVGGVWTYTQELTEGLLSLAPTGESNAVALASLGPAPSADQAAWAADLTTRHPGRFELTIIDAPLEWQPENSTAYTAAEPALLALAARFRPDVLHSSQFCFGTLPLPMPRVLVAHSDVLSWAEATRPHGLEPSPWLSTYTTLVQRGLSAATCAVAPTRVMHDALARNFVLPPYTAVIPNGRTLPPLAGIPPRRSLQAVTAGRLWDEAKGLSLLESLSPPLPILIAGPHHRSTPPADPNLHLLGPLPQPRLLSLFWQSAIYLCTSVYEPFGLAPLEAALCGCAVLANDIPSLREVWGESALFFHDASSLTHLLQHLRNNPVALAAAQQRSHLRASFLSGHSTTTQTLSLFHALLEQDPGKPHAAA